MDKTIRAWHFHAEMLGPQNILEDIPDEELAENAPEITEEQDLDLIEAAILARKFSIISARDDTILIKLVRVVGAKSVNLVVHEVSYQGEVAE